MDSIEELAIGFNEDTIIFVGSGISIPAGLPTWQTLICWLISYAKGLDLDISEAEYFITQKKFLDAVSSLERKLSTQGKTLENFFKEYEKCNRFHTATPKKIHELIALLPSKAIVTTNYDLLLEKIYETNNVDMNVVLKGDTEALDNIKRNITKQFIYKYHGCITKPETIVLNYGSYRELMHDTNPDVESLKVLMQTRKFVFLGSSLDDPDLVFLRDFINQFNKKPQIEFWAFLGNCNVVKEHYKEEHGIRLIDYKIVEDDHSDLANQLQKLIDKIGNELKQNLDNVDLLDTTAEESSEGGEELSRILNEANEKWLALDKKILGFVGILEEVGMAQCIDFFTSHEKHSIEEVSNRITHLSINELIIVIGRTLLSRREKYTFEAANEFEDTMVQYLMEKQNG